MNYKIPSLGAPGTKLRDDQESRATTWIYGGAKNFGKVAAFQRLRQG